MTTTRLSRDDLVEMDPGPLREHAVAYLAGRAGCFDEYAAGLALRIEAVLFLDGTPMDLDEIRAALRAEALARGAV